MSIKASATITLSFMVDIKAVYRYYKLQSSTATAPSVPTVYPPTDWTDTEPGYTSGSTNTLYFVDLTVFTNDTYLYSAVSKSSSYEAAKEAYNKATAATTTANTVQTNLNNMAVGGRNFALQSGQWENQPSLWVVNPNPTASGDTGGYLALDSTVKYDGYYTLKTVFPRGICTPSYYYKVEPGRQYTFSALIKSDVATSGRYDRPMHIQPSQDRSTPYYSGVSYNKTKQALVANQWTLVYVVFTCTVEYVKLYIMHPELNANVNIAYMKLEEGNMPTAWSPALEEMHDGLQFGGRNLLLNSKEFTATHTYNTVVTEAVYDDLKIRYLNNMNTTYQEFVQWTKIYPHRVGETYTFSFYAMGNGRCYAFFYGEEGCVPTELTRTSVGGVSTLTTGQATFQLTDEWTRYWVTWTLAEDGDPTLQKYLLLRANSETEMYVCGPKLEVGNKDTDWSAAPEDINEDILDAASTATDYLKVDGGLIVGDHTKSTLGKNILIDDDGMDVRDGDDVLASYGSSSIEFKKQVIFKADGMKIDNGDTLCNLGQNEILWVSTNGYWMTANQSINLTANISRMLTGVIFAWAGFENSVSTNSNWLYFFVPKSHVLNHAGASVYMNDPYLGVAKALHISNGVVTGHSTNNSSGTMNGIAYNNSKYTLRYVIGV